MKQSEMLVTEVVNSDWYREFISEDAHRQGIQLGVVDSKFRDESCNLRRRDESFSEGTQRVLAAVEESRPRGLAALWERLVDWLNG